MAGTRLQIVGSFVLFALLAAPVAWQLTQVERVPLPVARIQQLSWNASRFGGPETHVVSIFSLQNPATSVAPLSSSAPHVAYRAQPLHLDATQSSTLKHAASASLQATDDALKALVPTERQDSQSFSVFLLCDEAASSDAPLLVVGKYRHAWSSRCAIAPGDEVHSALERLTQQHLFPASSKRSEIGVTSPEPRTARMALHYRLQFSLLKENPRTPWIVDLAALVERYMGAMVRKASALANFTVETQVLQYARLAKDVAPSDDGKAFFVSAEDLKQFKSTNDFLATSVLADREQVLHFMAALPDEAHAPLYIRQSDTLDSALATSFELPGWGNVVILNPHKLQDEVERQKEMQRLMGLFVTQFRTLLAVPAFTSRQHAEDKSSSDGKRRLQFLASPVDGIADWELDVVTRSRFQRLLQTAIETLQSTVQLVEELSELSVLPRVQTRVAVAVERLETILCVSEAQTELTATQQCAAGSDLRGLLAMARQAAELTDAAYYDHTMIRQLYFPQEQMLGVYAPLLAPLVLPFLLGLVRELKRWKAKRAAKQSKHKTQ